MLHFTAGNSYFPTWQPTGDLRKSVVFRELPCIAAHMLQPADALEWRVNKILNSTRHTIAMHVRSNDR